MCEKPPLLTDDELTKINEIVEILSSDLDIFKDDLPLFPIPSLTHKRKRENPYSQENLSKIPLVEFGRTKDIHVFFWQTFVVVDKRVRMEIDLENDKVTELIDRKIYQDIDFI